MGMWLVSVPAARGEDSDQLRYYFVEVSIDDGPERDGNLDSVLLSISLHAYMADF